MTLDGLSTVASNVAVTTVGVATAVAFATVGMVHVQVFALTAVVEPVGPAVGGVTAVRPAGRTSVTTTFVASVVVSGLVTVTV